MYMIILYYVPLGHMGNGSKGVTIIERYSVSPLAVITLGGCTSLKVSKSTWVHIHTTHINKGTLK